MMRRALVLALLAVGCRHRSKITPTPVGTILLDVKAPSIDNGGVPLGPPAEAFQHAMVKVGVFSPAFYKGDGANFWVAYDHAKTQAVAGVTATTYANIQITVIENKSWAMSASCATGKSIAGREVSIPCTVTMRNGKEVLTLSMNVAKNRGDFYAQTSDGDWQAWVE